MGEEGKSDKRSGVDASGTRRAFLASAAACCAASAAAAGAEPDRVVIPGVDRSRAREPMYEGVRIVLSHMGERYSPAYIQGISGGAFRIAGICGCAANCSLQMDTPNLIKLLGYEYEQHILGWTGDVDDAKRNMVALIPRIKESIRAGRPVLLWYGFADTAYEVVVGYDDKKGVFLGRHMHQGPRDGLAEAKQTRAEEAASVCPAFGAIFIGKKTGKLNRRAAEIAALKEAVRHAHDAKVSVKGPPRSGLACYDEWVRTFQRDDAKRSPGDAYCRLVYGSTHRLAGQFVKEIAGRHARASEHLLRAAREFDAEADALDEAEPLIGWRSPELDAERNRRVWPVLSRARERYAAAIAHIESALPSLR